MSDDLTSEEMLHQNIDKIRVSSAEIMVHGTKEKPYYEIEYFDLSDNEMHIGYSSYNLDIVFEYLEKYFEIVNGEKLDKAQDYHSGDLISRKSLIENLNKFAPEHYAALVNDLIMKEPTAFDKEKVIEKLKRLEVNSFGYYNQYDDEQAFGESAALRTAIEIVEKGGIK